MKKFPVMLTLFLALVGSNTLLHADEKTAWREKLETAIPEGIKLLEAKEYVPFLKAFVAPEQLKKLLEQGSIEDFAKNFAERKAESLLKVMKAIKGTTPKLEKDGTRATYEISIEGVSKKDITFHKVEKFWYIAN